MTTSDPPTPLDPLAHAAALIRDVGLSAQRARRYRELVATVADPTFDRALALGSEVRLAGRGDSPHAKAVIVGAVGELQRLLDRCEAAIEQLRTGRPYQEAVTAFAARAAEQMAAMAPGIFTDVLAITAPTSVGTLYWPVPITSRRPGQHFLPPEECAASLHTMAAEGIVAAPGPVELGGDETIRPILLTDDHDGSESPLALAFDPQELPAGVCRLEGSHVFPFYASRLRANFAVSYVAEVNDEWWSIRPDAYRSYIEELRKIVGPLVLTSPPTSDRT